MCETPLEFAVGKMLLDKRLTIAAAESCTGGLLSHRLTSVPGSSSYFPLGLVTYDNKWKTELLGVEKIVLDKYGAVSKEVAAAMASGVRQKAKSDLGIGITGIAGPGGGSREKPVGLVYIGLSYDQDTMVKQFLFQGSRDQNKTQSAQAALEMIKDYCQRKK